MPRVLLVTPSLDHDGAARQLCLLSNGLIEQGWMARVLCLAGTGAEQHRLDAEVVDLRSRGPLDVSALWRLRREIRSFRPDAIHAWRPAAARAVALTHSGVPLVISRPLSRRAGSWIGQIDRWLLRNADLFIATGPAEAEECRRLGLPNARIRTIRPAVELPKDAPAELSPNARLIACAGPLKAGKGFQDALWAFDILTYLYKDLQLLMIGTGPEAAQLKRFARSIGLLEGVHWLGEQPKVSNLLQRAEQVWVLGRQGGVNAALEAQAAGRPVIAARRPDLAEIVAEGATGMLVPPDNPVTLARQARLLLDDAPLARRLGETAREHVAREHTVAGMVRGYAQLYEGILGRAPREARTQTG